MSKRNKGTGSLRQRKNGLWEGRYMGYSVYDSTKVLANKQLTKLISILNEGTIPKIKKGKVYTEQEFIRLFDKMSEYASEKLAGVDEKYRRMSTGEWIDCFYNMYYLRSVQGSTAEGHGYTRDMVFSTFLHLELDLEGVNLLLLHGIILTGERKLSLSTEVLQGKKILLQRLLYCDKTFMEKLKSSKSSSADSRNDCRT